MRRSSIVCTVAWAAWPASAAVAASMALAACGGSDTAAPDEDGGPPAAASTHGGSARTSGGSDGASSGDAVDASLDATVDATFDATTGDSGTSTSVADAGPDASIDAASDAGHDAAAPTGPTGTCTDTFGDGLTSDFGRLDGTLYAVVRPTDTSCRDVNSTHLVLQVAMASAIYEIDVNVQSDEGPADVFYATIDAPLVGAPYAAGWHTRDVELDYPSDLGVHSSSFVSHDETSLVDLVTAQLTPGAAISVYGHGFVTGAHDIHRYGASSDGAVVLAPTSGTPRWLLFHFDEQTF